MDGFITKAAIGETYATGNGANEVRTKFEHDNPSLPNVSHVKFRGYA